MLNNPANFGYKKTEEVFKSNQENDTSFSLNFSLPYNVNDKFKAGFKVQTKMRDDIWHEYDNGLANLDGVNTFDATITGYEAGANYKNGIFMTPQALGNLSLGGPTDPNLIVMLDEFAAGNYDADETITAYAMVEDKLSDDITLIAGARIESTK